MSYRSGLLATVIALTLCTAACAVPVDEKITVTVASADSASVNTAEIAAAVEVTGNELVDESDLEPRVVPSRPDEPSQAGTVESAVRPTESLCHPWDEDADFSIWTFDLPDAATTLVADVNRHGTVAAYTGSIPDGHRAYLARLDGSIEPIEVEGSGSTVPWVINDAEMVAGAYWPNSSVAAGFVRHPDGTLEKFDMPEPARFVDVEGANERGDIFGSYVDSAGDSQWYRRTAEGEVTKVQIPGFERIRLRAIDETGAIIGAFRDTDTWVEAAFSLNPTGELTQLAMPENWHGWIYAANDAGHMAIAVAGGSAVIRDGQIDLVDDVPGAAEVLLDNVRLTDDGTVAANFRDDNSQWQSFIRSADGTVIMITVDGSTKTKLRAARDGIFAGEWLPEESYEKAFVLLSSELCGS